MTFKLLADDLHSTAELGEKYFKDNFGAKKFRHEEPVVQNANLPLNPTFSAVLPHGYILCVEVSTKAYSNTLDSFVVECNNRGLPVKLHVVIPSAKGDRNFASHFKQAKSRGVGIAEISDGEKSQLSGALSLSLFGLRRLELKEFPANKRDLLKQAEETFLNGDPVKGCQRLFEELESVTRSFAQRSLSEGWWRAPHKGETGPTKNLGRDPWARVLSDLNKFLDFKSDVRKTCSGMNDGLIGSARGLTDPRNVTSHAPSNLQKIVSRDKKLRTWFENTGDILKSWYDATKPLRLS